MGTKVELVDTITLSVRECTECGIRYGMSERFADQRREDHRTWYCPNGHGQHLPQQTAAERFARERDEAQAALADERRENARLLGAKTRLEKRLKAGLCSQCNRHFTNVERHMKSKHKEAKDA